MRYRQDMCLIYVKTTIFDLYMVFMATLASSQNGNKWAFQLPKEGQNLPHHHGITHCAINNGKHLPYLSSRHCIGTLLLLVRTGRENLGIRAKIKTIGYFYWIKVEKWLLHNEVAGGNRVLQ
jgi:hypothetical protein